MNNNRMKTNGRSPVETNIGYMHARSLIDTTMLIIGLRPMQTNYPHPHFKFVVDARLPDDKRLHFPAGVVVLQQLQETPVLPVWARLLWHCGLVHSYYKLELAETIKVKRAKKKRRTKPISPLPKKRRCDRAAARFVAGL